MEEEHRGVKKLLEMPGGADWERKNRLESVRGAVDVRVERF